MKSNRIVWIDYLKVIAIYWVVLGHQPITNHNVHDWIFSFHVPVFFIISGYLMKNYKFDWLFVWKNFKKLILVIVPYRAICMILNYAVDLTFYTDQVSITHNLSDPILYFLIGDSRVGPACFLFVLFRMRITYCCLSQCLEFQYKDFVIFVISLLGPLVVVTFSIEYNYYQIASFMWSCNATYLCVTPKVSASVKNNSFALWNFWKLFPFFDTLGFGYRIVYYSIPLYQGSNFTSNNVW